MNKLVKFNFISKQLSKMFSSFYQDVYRMYFDTSSATLCNSCIIDEEYLDDYSVEVYDALLSILQDNKPDAAYYCYTDEAHTDSIYMLTDTDSRGNMYAFVYSGMPYKEWKLATLPLSDLDAAYHRRDKVTISHIINLFYKGA